jgi:DNA invertase Pin-like site-specific DNA recombinase
MLLRAACYIRVSTDDQTEFSPDAQLKAIQNYCKNNNMLLDTEHIYIDEGISGRKADKRPEFQNMIKHAKKKEFDVILVHKFDRFARSREDSVVYKSLLKRECGIKVISITESIEDDKFSVILEAMLEAMAEYYSLNLADEVKKGMTEKAERGEWQTYAPFGYKIVDKKLEILDEQASAVRMIFNDFINGEGYLHIAKKVNELGFRTRFGNKFENRTIEYILTNPVYKGYARWTPSGKMHRRHISPDTIVKKSNHEPIIDEKTFDEVQELIKQRKQIHRKWYKGTSSAPIRWLNGLVRCKTCGHTLVKTTGDALICNGYVKGTCPTSQRIKRNLIEDVVLEQIKNDFTQSVDLQKRLQTTYKDNTNVILSQLEKLPEKEARAKEAYINGIDTLEEYKANKENIENQRKLLEKSLKESEKPKNVEKQFKEKLKTVYEKLIDENVDEQEKFELAHLIIENIDFDKSAETLYLKYRYQM